MVASPADALNTGEPRCTRQQGKSSMSLAHCSGSAVEDDYAASESRAAIAPQHWRPDGGLLRCLPYCRSLIRSLHGSALTSVFALDVISLTAWGFDPLLPCCRECVLAQPGLLQRNCVPDSGSGESRARDFWLDFARGPQGKARGRFRGGLAAQEWSRCLSPYPVLGNCFKSNFPENLT